VQFTIDGERFELTADEVRSRTAAKTPGVIQTYWVEIEGIRWPVKQALAVALDPKRPRFQSHTARRHLQNLGFKVGPETTSSRRSKSSTRTMVEAAELPVLDSVEATIAFTWHDAGDLCLDQSDVPKFPPLPRIPGLYRFEFRSAGQGDVNAVYIGESQNLLQRGSNYRNAKTDRTRQRTNRRIHREIVGHISGGGTIGFAIATDARMGVSSDAVDLRWKSARRMAENAAVLLAQLSGSAVVLNIDADLDATEGDQAT